MVKANTVESVVFEPLLLAIIIGGVPDVPNKYTFAKEVFAAVPIPIPPPTAKFVPSKVKLEL